MLAAAIMGCGSEDRPNDARPPSPIALAATVNNDEVLLSERDVGAGPATVTVSNQSRDDVELTFDGPREGTEFTPGDEPPGTTSRSVTVAAGSTGNFKLDLEEGLYEVSAGPASAARPVALEVGPERPSSQNDLLLP